jgi:4-amino-4-deoxy-L-arabinose transferase-like glycosyltransferase
MPNSSMASRILSWMDRHPVSVFAIFTATFFATTLLRAETKPFWNDEIYTIVHARLPSVGAMWEASEQGFDLMPPLNAIFAHGLHALVGEGRVTTRLPAILGYWTLCLVVFEVVRRRAGVPMAVVAVALQTLAAAYRFSYEARGYGLLLAFSAIALYCWSEAAAGRHRAVTIPAMAVALTAGVWSHYFGVLTFMPIGIAEVWRQMGRRRLDVSMWVALLAACAGTLPLILLVGLVHRHTTAYWGAAASFGLSSVYEFIFLPVPDWGPIGAVCVVAFATLLVVTLVELPGWQKSRFVPVPSHEVVAVLALALLPVAGLILDRIVGSGLVPRYFLPVALSTVAIPIVMSRLAISPARLLTLVGVIGLGWLAQAGVAFAPGNRTFRDPVRDDPALMAELARPEPVVVTNGVRFLQLWFYAPSETRGRLTYLADEQLAVRHLGSATVDASLMALSRWYPTHLVPFEDFIKRVDAFSVYANGSGWLLDELRSRQMRLEPGPEGVNGPFFLASGPPGQ